MNHASMVGDPMPMVWMHASSPMDTSICYLGSRMEQVPDPSIGILGTYHLRILLHVLIYTPIFHGIRHADTCILHGRIQPFCTQYTCIWQCNVPYPMMQHSQMCCIPRTYVVEQHLAWHACLEGYITYPYHGRIGGSRYILGYSTPYMHLCTLANA